MGKGKGLPNDEWIHHCDNMYTHHNIGVLLLQFKYNTIDNSLLLYCTCYPYFGDVKGATRNNYKLKLFHT